MQAVSHYGCILPTPQDSDYPHFHAKWLDDVGDDAIAAIDRWEAHGDLGEVAEFGLSALSRVEQALILRTLENNLMPTKRIAKNAPSSYALKHAAEDALHDQIPYVSNLQVRSCMHIMGYRHTEDGKHPRYNVSLRSRHRYTERIRRKRWGQPDLRAIPYEERLFAGAVTV